MPHSQIVPPQPFRQSISKLHGMAVAKGSELDIAGEILAGGTWIFNIRIR